MKSILTTLAKLLYGAMFVLLVPAVLLLWARLTDPVISLPAIESKLAGAILMASGGLLMFWGMSALMLYGRGLPMNAYPPPLFVTQGPYRLFRHPIYWGFGLLMAGYFIYAGSASGIWMVTPLTVMGMVALVLGYESIELQKRFPGQSIRTILDYPENKENSANLTDSLTTIFWVTSFLFIANFFIGKLHGNVIPLFGKPLRLISSVADERLLWSGIAFLILFPLAIKKKSILRDWEITGFISIALSSFIAFLYPSIGAQYLAGQKLLFTSVPAFLFLVSLRSAFRESLHFGLFMSVVILPFITIQLMMNRSFPLNLAVSLPVFLLASNTRQIWITLRILAEKRANSWREWTLGKIRMINHGFYVGFGAFGAIFLAGILAGKEYALVLLLFTIITTICSALWAQIIEGSAKLKRPFGYYGGIVGIIFGSAAVWILGFNAWVVIGVASVVMPWAQAIGRLRCLVNGCCHGRKTDNPLIGIRYHHPRSRVCNISGLKNELIHPTPLYSILWLTWVGIFLLTLWLKGTTIPLLFGLYLILTSIGRFVEEAYRGEVQTPLFGGLHLYQWTAIISLLVGMAMTTIRIDPVNLQPGYSWEALVAALFGGLFIFFAMGVDFPQSNARFSRLV